jgi:ferric-dicitrate binding protein FerR (iron transport regulator)
MEATSVYIPISQEMLDDSLALAEGLERWRTASPEQRAEWARQAAAERAQERAASPPTALTLDALLDAAGWSREYATHLVQPSCTCGDSPDGWDVCAHARDLGLDGE